MWTPDKGPRLTSGQFKELLVALLNTRIMRVTGSYANGTNTVLSDIDFQVANAEDGLQSVIRILTAFGVVYNRPNQDGVLCTVWFLDYPVPIKLDFSTNFRPCKDVPPEVTIYEVTFPTY